MEIRHAGERPAESDVPIGTDEIEARLINPVFVVQVIHGIGENGKFAGRSVERWKTAGDHIGLENG
jgi:hypothetical protein